MSLALDMSSIQAISNLSGVPKKHLFSTLSNFYKTTENFFTNSEQACEKWFRLTSHDDAEEDYLEEITVYSCFNRLCVQEAKTATLDQARKMSTIPGSPGKMAVIKRIDFLTATRNDEITRLKTNESTATTQKYLCTEDAFTACRSLPFGSTQYYEAMTYYCGLFLEDLKKVETATEARNMAYQAIRGTLAEKTAKKLAKWLSSLERIKKNPRSVADTVFLYENLAGYN